MKLSIFQVGERVLRQQARPLSTEEIRSASIQQLIESMRETMRKAPGVGLAAPQVGQSLQLAVIEDQSEYMKDIPPERLTERKRSPVPFHVLINPQLSIEQDTSVEFFEGCLSVDGFVAIVPRAVAVTVKCLNEKAEQKVINARGWYARILQHEIDHLNGKLYIDHMYSHSFMIRENYNQYWVDESISQVCTALGVSLSSPR